MTKKSDSPYGITTLVSASTAIKYPIKAYVLDLYEYMATPIIPKNNPQKKSPKTPI